MGYVCGFTKKRIKPRDPRLGWRSGGREGRFRDLYVSLFRAWHILPSDLARQDPRLLLNVLVDDEPELPENMSPYMKMFYGF